LSKVEWQDSSLPGIRVRRAATFLILLHFVAIATAVTSASSGRFAAPSVAVGLSVPFRPYLRFLFLESPYRFFAPNPGPTLKLYFRIGRRHEASRWIEFPRRTDLSGAVPYHRALELVERNLRGSSPSTGMTTSEEGRIALSSFVRHVARMSSENVSDASLGPVSQIEAYAVEHAFLSPDQIRMGMKPTDLRLYRCHELGRFNSDGRRTDNDPVRDVAMETFATQMLVNDLLPLIKERKGNSKPTEAIKLAQEAGVPEPVLALIVTSPDLLTTSPDQMAARIHALVGETTAASGK
jgi:hypothetical protein